MEQALLNPKSQLWMQLDQTRHTFALAYSMALSDLGLCSLHCYILEALGLWGSRGSWGEEMCYADHRAIKGQHVAKGTALRERQVKILSVSCLTV